MNTVEEKLNKMCPYYTNLDELYGGRQNLNPSSVLDCDDSDSNSEGEFLNTTISDNVQIPDVSLEDSQNKRKMDIPHQSIGNQRVKVDMSSAYTTMQVNRLNFDKEKMEIEFEIKNKELAMKRQANKGEFVLKLVASGISYDEALIKADNLFN